MIVFASPFQSSEHQTTKQSIAKLTASPPNAAKTRNSQRVYKSGDYTTHVPLKMFVAAHDTEGSRFMAKCELAKW
jgi:hypothetical protein